jgi:hypothetical protein
VATAVMTGIHDVFPSNITNKDGPISEKKLLKCEGQYSTLKTLLGFDFYGTQKTLWLEEEKCAKLLTTLKGWIRSAAHEQRVGFKEFESVTAKLQNAFLVLPGGRVFCCHATDYSKNAGRLFIFIEIMPSCQQSQYANHPPGVNYSTNVLLGAGCRVAGLVGVADASSYGVGGVIIGKLSPCPPTVFCQQWPPNTDLEIGHPRFRALG